MISGKTAIYCIFGHPIEHTFSPGMHNAAFEKIGLNARYVPFAVRPDRLAAAAAAIIPMGIRGLNITVPHKEKIISSLDELTEDAAMIGAVNTVEVRGEKLVGHNTDGRGFLRSLREETSLRPKNKTVLIIGAGGAARSVGFNFALAGSRNILLHDTDSSKAVTLASDIRTRAGAQVAAVDAASLAHAASEAQIIINATPLGLKKSDRMPLPLFVLKESHLVCDLVYNPSETAFLKAARSKGAATLRGIGMLLYQGVIAFEIWTRKRAPVEIMRRSLVRQVLKGKK